MRVLVTGADGFVGSRLVPKLSAMGHEVGAGVLPTAPLGEQAIRRRGLRASQIRELDLLDAESVNAVLEPGWDTVIHLAAVASGSEANRDPVMAWAVNTLGTLRLTSALAEGRSGANDPLVLLVSTAEVYGPGEPIARVETDDVRPCSPYAASKLAAEIGALETARRTGLKVVIARPFQHTGAGQDGRFVVPAFAKRIRDAKKRLDAVVQVGNMDPVRDFLHVDDVVEAYLLLIEFGCPGEIYNIASGIGVSVRDVFSMVSSAVEHRVTPEVAEALMRPADVPHLVGDSEKLRMATGWLPRLSIEQAVQEVVDAQTD